MGRQRYRWHGVAFRLTVDEGTGYGAGFSSFECNIPPPPAHILAVHNTIIILDFYGVINYLMGINKVEGSLKFDIPTTMHLGGA